jgi:hypothetical protein
MAGYGKAFLQWAQIPPLYSTALILILIQRATCARYESALFVYAIE